MEWFLKNRREGGTEKRKKQRQGTLTGHKWRDNTLREFLQTSKQTFRNFSISKSTVLKGQVNIAITVKQAPEAIRPWSQLFQVKHYEAKRPQAHLFSAHYHSHSVVPSGTCLGHTNAGRQQLMLAVSKPGPFKY